MVHPLATLASTARACLKREEAKHNVASKTFGKDCAAANVLHVLTTLRFKCSVGDPQGLKRYFKEHDIPVGLIIRYVGNRLHVLFHLAAVVFLHLDVFLEFFNPKNGRDSTLKKALYEDMNNPHIVIVIQALGLLGKILTGPWMTAFYRDGKHMDAAPKAIKSYRSLQSLHDEPESYLSTTDNIFGDTVDNIDSLCQLQRSSMEQSFIEILKALSASMLLVFQRQLKDFLPDGKFINQNEELREKASGAPLHNMASERALGMTDKTWRRAPNARIGFVSGKTAAKMNHLLSWLSCKPQEEQHKLINFAIPEGYQFHKNVSNRALLTSNEIVRRHIQIRQKKEKTDCRMLERTVKKSIIQASSALIASLTTSLAVDVENAEEFIMNYPCSPGD